MCLLRVIGIYLEAYSRGVVCLSASYPLKELPALRPLYINHEMFFVTHLRPATQTVSRHNVGGMQYTIYQNILKRFFTHMTVTYLFSCDKTLFGN